MENNNNGFENNNPESSPGRENNNNNQAPLGFDGMNFEQKRGRYGASPVENSRKNNNDGRKESDNRQEQ